MSSGILIADDSDAVRRVLRNHLTKKSLFVCGEAEDGDKAIEQAQKLKPEVIILDLAMPCTNGYVAASVLKDLLPNVRIVLFTMYSDALARTFGLKGLKVDAVITKGEDSLPRLTDCVQSLLNAAHGGHPREKQRANTTIATKQETLVQAVRLTRVLKQYAIERHDAALWKKADALLSH